MRKLFMFLMALLLPLFALKMSADDEKAIMKIPIELGPEENLTRSLIEEPIMCHYHGMITSIVTAFNSNLGDVSLTVTNTSTGEAWHDVFDSATEPQTLLPISSTPGLYEIVYTTQSGDVYEGSFIIN